MYLRSTNMVASANIHGILWVGSFILALLGVLIVFKIAQRYGTNKSNPLEKKNIESGSESRHKTLQEVKNVDINHNELYDDTIMDTTQTMIKQKETTKDAYSMHDPYGFYEENSNVSNSILLWLHDCASKENFFTPPGQAGYV